MFLIASSWFGKAHNADLDIGEWRNLNAGKKTLLVIYVGGLELRPLQIS